VRLGDIRLARRAFRERWPLTEANRRKIVDKLLGVVSRPKTQACLVQAAKALLEADKINIAERRLLQDADAASRPPITVIEVVMPAPKALGPVIEVVDRGGTRGS
jgi:hypothetical protein